MSRIALLLIAWCFCGLVAQAHIDNEGKLTLAEYREVKKASQEFFQKVLNLSEEKISDADKSQELEVLVEEYAEKFNKLTQPFADLTTLQVEERNILKRTLRIMGDFFIGIGRDISRYRQLGSDFLRSRAATSMMKQYLKTVKELEKTTSVDTRLLLYAGLSKMSSHLQDAEPMRYFKQTRNNRVGYLLTAIIATFFFPEIQSHTLTSPITSGFFWLSFWMVIRNWSGINSGYFSIKKLNEAEKIIANLAKSSPQNKYSGVCLGNLRR